MPINDRSDIHWAPKVSLSRLRLLYLREAQGICEDDLLDEVGMSLYCRCDSILEFTEAVEKGRVRCKRCETHGTMTILQRQTGKPGEMLKCSVCSWQIRWRVYLKEAENTGNLHAGHAQTAFERYVRVYPQCQSVREKMVAIDQLIHEFHWLIMEDKQPIAIKPAGVNLLQGSSTQVLALLNELTYGSDSPPELLKTRDRWLSSQAEVEKRISKLITRGTKE